MNFTCSLWLPFLDQPQQDVVVFAIIYFDNYKYLVIEWKNGISINDINENLETLLTAIVKLKNIDEYSHEEGVVISSL